MGMFTEEPLFDDPNLPAGWYRKVVQRQTGATAGQWDVYVFNPEGKKFRSRNELAKHFQQIRSNLNSEDFDFSVKGKGHHNKDGAAASTQTGLAGGVGEQRKPKIKVPNKSNNSGSNSNPLSGGKKRKADVGASSQAPAVKLKFKPKPMGVVKPKVVIKEKPAVVKSEKPAEAKSDKPPTTSKYFPPPSSVLLPKTKDERVRWDPPQSPYHFIQEYLYRHPWQLLVATIFMNKTKGEDACPLVWKFLERWPTPQSVTERHFPDIAQLMKPLGLYEVRAERIVKMSADYIGKDWKDPSELHGIGKYGSDSYRIFCLGEWKEVRPTDIMLKLYQDWVWTNSKVLKLE